MGARREVVVKRIALLRDAHFHRKGNLRNAIAMVAVRRVTLFHVAVTVALACSLMSCASEEPAPPPPTFGAQISPTGGSTIKGRAAFSQVGNGVVMSVNLGGGGQGSWRVVIHSTGICTSPNGFSAGPPVMLPGTSTPALVFVMVNSDKSIGQMSARLPGLKLNGPEGIVGKSVVVHSAQGSLEAEPGVPNNRVGCGVIQPMAPMF